MGDIFDRIMPTPNGILGLRQPGNINLTGRPILHNPDGTISSEQSFSIGTEKGETLLPLIVDGKQLTQSQAIDHYRHTGEHMGIFDTPEHADTYANSVHNRKLAASGDPVYAYQDNTASSGDIFDRVAGSTQKPPPNGAWANPWLSIARANIAKYPENQPTHEVPNYDPGTGMEVGTVPAGPSIDVHNAQQSIVPQAAVPALQGFQTHINDRIDRISQAGAGAGLDLAVRALVTPPGDEGFDPNRPDTPVTEQEVQERLKSVPAPVQGIARAAGSTVGGVVADPRMWPLFFAGPEVTAGKTALSAGFGTQMAAGAYEQAGELGKVLDNPDVSTAQKWEMGAGAGISTIMGGMAFGHSINERLRPTIPSPDVKRSVTPAPDVSRFIDKAQDTVTASIEDKSTVNSGGFGVEKNSKDIFDTISGQGELFPERRESGRPGLDRRQDSDTRKLLSSLSPEEKDAEIARIRKEQRTAPLTDLPNSKALSEAGLDDSHPHVGFADVDDFKGFNTDIGHEAVDAQVLPTLGKLFKDAIAKEPVDSIYAFQKTLARAGDEFVLRSTSPDAISRVVNRVNDAFSSTIFESASGSKKGTGLSHGVGSTVEEAELASNTDKANRKALGLRTGTRDNVISLDTTRVADSIRAVTDKEPVSEQPVAPQVEAPASPRPSTPVHEDLFDESFPAGEIVSSHAAKEMAPDQVLAAYGKAKNLLSTWSDRLDLAKRAQIKGFSRGAKTPEEMAQMAHGVTQLRAHTAELFKRHVQGLDDKEIQALVTGIEQPIYKQIGKALQLHTLLSHDIEAKRLKGVLNEDISQSGLSETSKQYLHKYFPAEKIASRLTRGKGGQRTRIYNKLGYEESSEQSFKLLRFLPDLDRAKRIEAGLKDRLSKETDLTKRAAMQEGVTKAESIRQKFEDIHGQVASAREVAASMAETETHSGTKAFLDRLNEKRTENLEDADGNIVAKKGDYKVNPIIINPRVKGTPRNIATKFTDVALPGEIKEISTTNLKAILGSEFTKSYRYLRPQEKEALNALAPAEMKNTQWYLTPAGREYTKLHQEFIRNRVEEIRDTLARRVKDNMGLVKAIKEARGIPADHLTPLETSVSEMIQAFKERKEPTSAPRENNLLTNGEIPGSKEETIVDMGEGRVRAFGGRFENPEPPQKVREYTARVGDRLYKYQMTENAKEIYLSERNPELRAKIRELEPQAEKFFAPHEKINVAGAYSAYEGGFGVENKKTPEASAKVTETPRVVEEARSAQSTDPIGQLQGVIDNLKSGKPIDPQLMQKLKDIGVVKEGMGNGAIADTLQKYVNRQRGVDKAKVTRASKQDPVQQVTAPDPISTPKPPLSSEGAKAESALSPAETAAHTAVRALESDILKTDPTTKASLDMLQKAAGEVGTSRLDRYLVYKNGLEMFKVGLEKGDGWAMFNAADTVRRPNERGTIGPSRRTLSDAEIKEGYRVYAHTILNRYEKMTDLQQARFREKFNDGVLERAVKESENSNVAQRFETLQKKIGTNDPISRLGAALIDGRTVTARDAAEGIMREQMGKQKLDKIQINKLLEASASRWDSAKIADSVDFINAMETGDWKGFEPEDKNIGSALRALLDDRRTKLQNLGTGLLDDYIEHYFPHLWSNVGKARNFTRDFLSRKPLAGDAGFLKQREYSSFREGLATGLQPVTWNPVKMSLARLEQIDKFIAANKMAEGFKSEGLVKYVRLGGEIPTGWVEMKDRIFTAAKRDEKTGAVMTFGKYYGPPDVAKVFNNHLSPGLSSSHVYNIIRTYGNSINQANLVGGVFHLIESGFNTAVSDVALSLQQLTTKGQRLGALKSFSRGAFMPASVVDAYFNTGRKMMAEAAEPGTFAQYARSVDAMSKAGGTLQLDPQYLNQGMEKFRTNLKTALDSDMGIRKQLQAGVKLPIAGLSAILDKANWFVMERFVPRMKAATFHRMAEQIQDKLGPNTDPRVMRMELGKAWDSVDNRLGELVYDNLFWNRSAKDIALVAFRSTGWNLGTVREIGGGSVDLGRTLRTVVDNTFGNSPKKKIELSSRTAYTIALTGTVMSIGAAMTYMATGHGPQSLTDYFYPPDGTTGPDGKPNRQYLKTYVHDVNSLIHDLPKSAVETLAHKASPMWSQIYDIVWANADYYGREIVHPDDSSIWGGITGNTPLGIDKEKSVGKFLLNSSKPFFYQNFQEQQRRDSSTASKVSSLFGILPAPKWAGQSKAEALAYELSLRAMPQGPRDAETFDRTQAVDKLRNQYAHGNASVSDLIKAAESGTIRYKDIENVAKESDLTPLQRHVSHLPAKDAMRVWELATPEEQQKLNLMMWKKFSEVYKDYSPEEQKILEAQYTNALMNQKKP